MNVQASVSKLETIRQEAEPGNLLLPACCFSKASRAFTVCSGSTLSV